MQEIPLTSFIPRWGEGDEEDAEAAVEAKRTKFVDAILGAATVEGAKRRSQLRPRAKG